MTMDIRELPSRLDELIALASAGHEIVFVDRDLPLGRLVPIASCLQRTPGLHPGAMIPADDFDDPLPDSFWA